MAGSEPRGLTTIDAHLRALQAVRRDARIELAEVRRRQAELAEFEAELVVAIEVRSRRIDDVLDERLRSVADSGPSSRVLAFDAAPALADVS